MNKFEDNPIISDILKNEKFNLLKKENHHGITRYEHSLRVAKWTYNISKFYKKDNINLTRAALLHDFYTNDDIKNKLHNKKLKHPLMASVNATAYFNISPRERNIIESHMFPLCSTLPRSFDAVLVDMVDNIVATYEMLRYKYTLSILILFFFNFIAILSQKIY